MRKKVLIIGSGGINKYDYLTWLERLGAEVVLLEPENMDYDYVPKYKRYVVPFTDIDAVVEKARAIAAAHSINVVDTIYELAMEHAATVRKTLGISGLTPECVNVARNKIAMAEFMKSNGIRCAHFIKFSQQEDLGIIHEKMQLHGDHEWILRPDRLGSNIGIRKIKTADAFMDAFKSAHDDLACNQYSKLLYDVDHKWMLSKYIAGYELEAEICIHKGEIIFLCPLFKTVIQERESRIEENRCVTPAPWLDTDDLADMNLQIQRLAAAVYEKIMIPCGRETLIVYAEFRIDSNKNAYVLEFAFRNGGYLNPMIIEMSTGISPCYLSAAATLGVKPEILPEKKRCAVGYQSIYSDRKGIFECVKDIEQMNGIIIKNEVSPGYKISVPHSEIVTNVIASAETAEKVDELLNDALRNAKVVVDGLHIDIPLSSFVQ